MRCPLVKQDEVYTESAEGMRPEEVCTEEELLFDEAGLRRAHSARAATVAVSVDTKPSLNHVHHRAPSLVKW